MIHSYYSTQAHRIFAIIDYMTPEIEAAFWRIHTDLPRQAPGSDDSTQKLLDLANVPAGATALDIGCGAGRSALVLAQHGLQVTAIDTEPRLLDELNATAKERGLADRITTEQISMFAMPYPNASFDLIWSEGAAYIAGWGNALRDWRRLLKPGGRVVLTECCWLTDTPSPEAREFWHEGYPTMLTAEQAVTVAETLGFTVDATYTLPDSDWWDEYYTPLQARFEQLEDSGDPAIHEVIAMETTEINLRKKYASEYGYVGFVLR